MNKIKDLEFKITRCKNDKQGKIKQEWLRKELNEYKKKFITNQ